MAAVVDLAGVTIVRERLHLDRRHHLGGRRGRPLGDHRAQRRRQDHAAAGVSAQIHPTSGVAGLLGEVLGTVDVFELRPRIGLTSAALAERIPRGERVHDVVVSASYAVVGRWREEYDELDHERADELLAQLRIDAPGRPHVRHPQRGRAQAGADRPGADDRSRAAAARRAGRRPRPGRPRDLVSTLGELAQDPYAPATVLVTHHVEEIPAGITHALLLKGGEVVAAGPLHETLTAENLTATFDAELSLAEADGRWAARAL